MKHKTALIILAALIASVAAFFLIGLSADIPPQVAPQPQLQPQIHTNSPSVQTPPTQPQPTNALHTPASQTKTPQIQQTQPSSTKANDVPKVAIPPTSQKTEQGQLPSINSATKHTLPQNQSIPKTLAPSATTPTIPHSQNQNTIQPQIHAPTSKSSANKSILEPSNKTATQTGKKNDSQINEHSAQTQTNPKSTTSANKSILEPNNKTTTEPEKKNESQINEQSTQGPINQKPAASANQSILKPNNNTIPEPAAKTGPQTNPQKTMPQQPNHNQTPTTNNSQPPKQMSQTVLNQQKQISSKAPNIQNKIKEQRPHSGKWFNNGFFEDHHHRHAFHMGDDNWCWQSPSWQGVVGWLPWGGQDPIYYSDAGEPYIVEPEMYVTSQPSYTPTAQENWMPLGVFATGHSIDDTSSSTQFMQLALAKDGLIAGTYYNTASDEVLDVQGQVDPSTQKASWKVADVPNSPTMTTGLYNLTQDATVVENQFDDGTVEPLVFVRLNK